MIYTKKKTRFDFFKFDLTQVFGYEFVGENCKLRILVWSSSVGIFLQACRHCLQEKYLKTTYLKWTIKKNRKLVCGVNKNRKTIESKWLIKFWLVVRKLASIIKRIQQILINVQPSRSWYLSFVQLSHSMFVIIVS